MVETSTRWEWQARPEAWTRALFQKLADRLQRFLGKWDTPGRVCLCHLQVQFPATKVDASVFESEKLLLAKPRFDSHDQDRLTNWLSIKYPNATDDEIVEEIKRIQKAEAEQKRKR